MADSTKEKFAESEKQRRNLLSYPLNSFLNSGNLCQDIISSLNSFIHSLSAHYMTDAVGGTRDIVVFLKKGKNPDPLGL